MNTESITELEAEIQDAMRAVNALKEAALGNDGELEESARKELEQILRRALGIVDTGG